MSTPLFQFARQSSKVFQRLQAFLKEQQDDSYVSTPGFDELRSNFSKFLGDCFDEVIVVIDAIVLIEAALCMHCKELRRLFPL